MYEPIWMYVSMREPFSSYPLSNEINNVAL